MPNILILLGKLLTIINARVGTGASDTFALPSRTCILTWQTTFDVAPAVIDIDIDVSLDGTAWTTIDTSTAVGGEVRVIAAATGALFIRAIVNTNTGNRAVTLTLVAKVANP